jgi:hypothetical protein
MKKFFVIIVTCAGLFSCTKQVTTHPGAANQNTFFRDANVVVENMTAKPTEAGTITISFSTVFESNINRIELMSGADASNFCTTQAADITGNSSAHKSYSFSDANIKSDTMCYLLRFKDNNGNWAYSSYVTVKVK